MYPFKDDYTLLRDCWYVGALSSEVSSTPLGRYILDEPLVFYRTEQGEAVATTGLCPHRFFPLSKGSVEGDAIVCAYHGIAFGADGRCVRVPTQASLALPDVRIRTYPCIERGGLIWVWTGIAEEADEALMPDLEESGITAPGFWVFRYSWLPIEGRYMALCENLTDLSHIGALHARSAPAADHWITTPLSISEEGGAMRIVRATSGPWNGFLEHQYGPEMALDGQLEMHTQSDIYSHTYIRTSGFIIDSIAGQDSVPAEYGLNFHHHFITPARKNSCHYFGCLSRNYRFNDPEFDRRWEESDALVRQEDVEGVEALEPFLDEYGDPRRELIVKSDTGSVRFRRGMQRKLNAERERYAERAAAS